MACNCVNELNEILKEKYNRTANLNYESLSGRVVVTGKYHKLYNDGSYNPYAWLEVTILPKFCPFCGKAYDENELDENVKKLILSK